MFQSQLKDMYYKMDMFNPEKKILKNLDIFVLDNSLRETSFGQLRGHTLENKWKIYNEVRKVGFTNIIVESFNHMTRMGDAFIRQLKAKGDNVNYFAFTDFIEKIIEDRIPDENALPNGLLKMKELGICNIVIELDLVYHGIDYNIFNGEKLCKLLAYRFEWIRKNLSRTSMIFVNIRDFADSMESNPRRVFYLVNYLSSLPAKERICGIAFEGSGKHMPEEFAVWTNCIRKEMNRCGWNDGHLIVHIQERFGMADVTQLDCLANGATGIWAGLCEEGASLGHASSCMTLMNLIRIGNKRVVENYNCEKLREAARNITLVATDKLPHEKRPVVGERALDIEFGREIGTSMRKNFSLPDFFGEKPIVRITTSSTPGMLVKKLESLYGKDYNFTQQRAEKMKKELEKDRDANKREEYNSCVGIAILYERAGGRLNNVMKKNIEKAKENEGLMANLIREIRELWDEWDIRDGVKDNEVDLDIFYNGFMAPYFGCYRSDETKKALRAIDVDADGKVHWDEFGLYLRWAARQYPDITTSEELLDVAFRKGLLPAMQFEISRDVPKRKTAVENEDKEYYEEVDFDSDIGFTGV